MSLQTNGSPSLCVARRRLSMASVGKGSFRRRIKGGLAGSFLGSMSSRWSLHSKDGLADFILNENGIRLDPLVKKNKDMNDTIDSGIDAVAYRSRSYSESLPRRRGSGLLNEPHYLQVGGWGRRSDSPGRWSQATSGVRSLSPWRNSPGSGRRHRRPSGGRHYHRNHRHSDGDVLKDLKPFDYIVARKHRHSDGDVLSKYVEDLKQEESTPERSRKRCISEGDVDVTDPSKSDGSPKIEQRTESKNSILADDENEYVETIISSVRRNSITDKYRKDILIRNGFNAGSRGGFIPDHRNGIGRTAEHRYRNSYYGSFGSLDSIDSWSSCDSIEDIDELGEEKVNKSNDLDISGNTDQSELTPETENDMTKNSPVIEHDLNKKMTSEAGPSIITIPEFDAHLENGRIDQTFETASWIDQSYWNWDMLRSDARYRRSLSIRNSRRQRLRDIRRRSYGDSDRRLENDFYNGYVPRENHAGQLDDTASLAELAEEKEKSTDTLESCGTCSKGSKKCILEYLDRESELGHNTNEMEHEHDQNSNDTESSEAEFVCLLKDQVSFCSGKHGNTENGHDDVELVFDAINKEAKKPENAEKDLMVVFFVGGDVKILRRSGLSRHGDSIVVHSDLPSMTRKDLSTHNGSHDFRAGHSVHDVNRGRPKSAIIVTRSQSFRGDMANRDGSPGGAPAVVLGESFRHHRGGPVLPPHPKASSASKATGGGFHMKKSPKVPKVPRPNRALLMFQSVKKGIREFIEATTDDISQLKQRESDSTSTAQGKLLEMDKQIKSAERYLKRLEFHLSKLDELHDNYLLQQKMREGVRTMHQAYVTSPGNQRHTLSNVKYGYKECTQTMCQIEAQLENMMGTFNCKLKGMAGFARLCPGDVFEVTVRHGTQKWKTKGRVEKGGNQKWEIPEFVFKAVVGDIINIKGVELRAFKSVVLGQKSCEIKDLFSANPQLMTVSINVNGSLKLSIIITWNPLDGMDESVAFVEPAMLGHGTPRRRPVSVIALNGEYDPSFDSERRFSSPSGLQRTADDNFILRTQTPTHPTSIPQAYHGFDSPHVQNRHSDHMARTDQSAGVIGRVPYLPGGYHSSPYLPGDITDSRESRETPDVNTQQQQTPIFSTPLPSVLRHLHFPSVSLQTQTAAAASDSHSVLTLEDSLHSLRSALEDYHGQYTELQRLEELLRTIEKLTRKHSRSSSRSSSISVSIESALEAFDFLDTEEGSAVDPQSPTTKTGPKSQPTFDDLLCSPESTAKTGDSGIESLAQRLSEDTQLGDSLGSSPVPPTTGNEQVDQSLMYHLNYCERLLDNLGTFGPLKCREIYALDKLQKQTDVIESLVTIAKSGSELDLHSVMSSICDDKSLREFWVKCTDQHQLYIHPDRLLSALEQKYGAIIAEKHQLDPNIVCKHIITRVLDISDYDIEKSRPNFVMTLHQFMMYFTEEGGLKHVEDVAAEMKLIEKFTSGNPDVIIKAILMLRDTLPSPPCLKVLGILLISPDKEVEQCTISYLNLIQRKKENRDKAMVVYVEGLEDRLPELRAGACAALAILEASEGTDQLAYLCQSDTSTLVQKKAKDALLSLGEEGRKAFEDAQLSRHGFQGVHVHKSPQ